MRILQIGEKVLVRQDATTCSAQTFLLRMEINKGCILTIVSPAINRANLDQVQYKLNDGYYYLRSWLIPVKDMTLDDLLIHAKIDWR